MRASVSCQVSTILLGQFPANRGKTGLRKVLPSEAPSPLGAAQREQAQHLEAGVRGKECGHAGRVVGRRQLDTVETPEVDPRERAHISERLPARGAADLGR